MKSVEHTGTFELTVGVEKLFPLFSPEAERFWVPGWDYQNLMGTTVLSEDYVFLTDSRSHGVPETVWLVKRFDPNAYHVEFYKVEPGNKVGVVKVRCEELASDRTRVEVSYKYTALSGSGEQFIDAFTGEAFGDFIGAWPELLSNYLASKS
jgi:ribosomal protein L19